ncbi:hypothetical protein RJ639_030069 [Escallonia herrerae]|uniref:C2 NT-type domain-containing protein n=1 Tax=Escallonia herrerae TaxID=1293975 RepID=A0AA88XDR5_9ASTE|nr:hypothetical protein RJ639_030069 [Escallonia herrerae]
MVLGLNTKSRKGDSSLQVEYQIHIEEVKPWPPSQSLRSLRSALIQWEHGDRHSGSSKPVVPLLGSGSGASVGDGKIEFNESFRLPVTLLREMSSKGGDGRTFQKNCIEFNLYEPRRDKTRGQLLGTAVVDLADYGIVRETLSVGAPMNSKRSFSNTAPPMLYLKIQPVEKRRSSSLLRDSLLREASMDRNAGESVSALMNEEYAEEAEIASFSDDDVSSQSSMAVSSSAFESNGHPPPTKEENRPEAMKDSPAVAQDQYILDSKQRPVKSDMKESPSCSSSTDISSDLESTINALATLHHLHEPSLTTISTKTGAHSVQSSSSSIAYEGTEEELNTNARGNGQDNLAPGIQERFYDDASEIKNNAQESTKGSISNGSLAEAAFSSSDIHVDRKLRSRAFEVDGDTAKSPTKDIHETPTADVADKGFAEDEDRERRQASVPEREILQERSNYIEDELNSLESDALSVSSQDLGVKSNIPNTDRLKHVKSVRSSTDLGRSNGSLRSNQYVEKVKDAGVLKDTQNGARSSVSNEIKVAKVYPMERRNTFSDRKIQQLENRIKMLEGELREAAAIEVGLYSVVAEHGSSITKVHAPARRLSRLYLHACKESSQSRAANAARSAVSGLALVAKACGNDVPRLTFWLSNSAVLRATIVQAFEEQNMPLSAGRFVDRTSDEKGNKKKSSPIKWKDFSSSKETRTALSERFDDWGDPRAFTSSLEKVEAWIFSRIVESIWWQTLTPHMQSAATKATSRVMGSDSSKGLQRTSSSADQKQGNFSLEHWEKAFRDACERICPVRAAGHECGCLPILLRLIMEQCVTRLDVAMFNAILRESADEIPTDPISDPISDAKVLPIPAGKASFGSGAQLKNAIGNWSRWLTDLFGIDDDVPIEDEDEPDNEHGTSLKSFHLLNALSDLMMLPKDMLLTRSIRTEVCPTFGASLIKRILDAFVPDEFCPDPIPEAVLEALDLEDPSESGEGSVLSFPCTAASIAYMPPSAASVANTLRDGGSQSQPTRSGSLVLRKSYTSDDELDELDSPLISIVDGVRANPAPTKLSWTSKGHGSRNAVRYQLLREVWTESEQ